MSAQMTTLEHRCNLNVNDEARDKRLTGIICTIGPNTRSVEMLTKLRISGMNIVRMNFSHGTHEYHQSVIDNTRESCRKHPLPSPTAIALDTKGPEIRTGLIEGGGEVTLEEGQDITITTDIAMREKCGKSLIYVDYENIVKVIKPGKLIYIDDGLLSIEVVEINGKEIKGKVINRGILSSQKGVNLPLVPVDLPALSEKDKKDLQFGVENGVDMVFASFIRHSDDIKEIRKVLGEKGRNIKIIAKVENHQGVENFLDILKETDGVMVARGDLGIEIPPEKVFLAQKFMIANCNRVGKPVICATQMLESMTLNPRPTRAEVSDVANAVMDGADCVMLSGETAKGKYPIEAVQMMAKICCEAESAINYASQFNQISLLTPKPMDTVETIAASTARAAFELGAAAIIVLSTTGTTARLIAKYKPPVPILMITRRAETSRLAHLYRAVLPLHYASPRGSTDQWQKDVDARIEWGISKAKEMDMLSSGGVIIAVTGWSNGPQHTNTMRVLTV
jgi:pyruvate kinase